MKEYKNTENIFTELMLEKAHVYFVEDQIENINDKKGEITDEDEATLNFLYQEKESTLDRIKQLKTEYNEKNNYTSVTGKIIIEYDNIPDDIRWDIYHLLNKYALTVPGFSYRTLENQTYSKDYSK